MGFTCILRCHPPSMPDVGVWNPGHTTKRFCEEPPKIAARAHSCKGYIHTTKIKSIPDNVLLEVFYLYRRNHDPYYVYGCHFHSIRDWHKLAHVCSKWRNIIFSSPRRLGLQLLCTNGTPVTRNLGCWPPFPLVIDCSTYCGADDRKSLTPSDEDNIVAALEASDRVHYVGIPVISSLLGKMTVETRKPFPTLTHLSLSSKDKKVPALPDGFLGRSTPALRVAHLEGIPFPALPTLLSSAHHLVDLQLLKIPTEGYISPEAMVASLATLTGLITLLIGFKSPTRSLETSFQHLTLRTCLPSLTTFGFHGVAEYLEDLVSRIDTPQLDYIRISYFNRLDFYVPKLSSFIGRTQNLHLARFKRARIDFGSNDVYVSLYNEREEVVDKRHISLQISCRGLDWQVSHVAQILSQPGAMISNVGDLAIEARDPDIPPGGNDFMDDIEWLALLRLFIGVETLHVSEKLAGHVARRLEGVTEATATQMLPALHSLCLEGTPLTSLGRFVAIRQLSGVPVNVLDAPAELFERSELPSEFRRVPYSSD
ncbi:hypothetical protein V8E53_007568 [Lactarius tabidus]